MPTGQVLEFDRVTKRFGAVTAVSDLSVRVEPGAVTGFLGPNGAGKTTTLRMLLGQIRPSSGTATIGGVSYAELRHPLRTVGAVLEESPYRPRRTAVRQLSIAAKANGIPASRVGEVLRLVGLQDDAETRLGSYSLGMRQRLAVATALLGDPGALVLDEPANGLDPEGIRWMRLLMRRLADEGRTVLVSSHVLSEIEQVADDVVVLSKGTAVYSGSIDALADPSGGAVIVDAEDRGGLATALQAAGLSFDVLRSGVTVRDSDAAAVGAVAAAAGIALTVLQQRGPSLEEVFLDLIYGRRGDSPRLDEAANPVVHAPRGADGADAAVAATTAAASMSLSGAAATVASDADADADALEADAAADAENADADAHAIDADATDAGAAVAVGTNDADADGTNDADADATDAVVADDDADAGAAVADDAGTNAAIDSDADAAVEADMDAAVDVDDADADAADRADANAADEAIVANADDAADTAVDDVDTAADDVDTAVDDADTAAEDARATTADATEADATEADATDQDAAHDADAAAADVTDQDAADDADAAADDPAATTADDTDQESTDRDAADGGADVDTAQADAGADADGATHTAESDPFSDETGDAGQQPSGETDESETGEHHETEQIDETPKTGLPDVLPLATESVSVPVHPDETTFTELITGIRSVMGPGHGVDNEPATEAIPLATPAPEHDEDDDDAGVDDVQHDPRLAAMRTSLSSAASRFFDGPAPDYPYRRRSARSEADADERSGDADEHGRSHGDTGGSDDHQG